MSELTVTKNQLFAGVWEGVVSGGPAGEPVLEVTHQGKPVSFFLTRNEGERGTWVLRIAVPVELLSDGVQVFLICDGAGGALLNEFTIISGEPLQEDIRGELELLRDELDMLKRAFRRHCVETS